MTVAHSETINRLRESIYADLDQLLMKMELQMAREEKYGGILRPHEHRLEMFLEGGLRVRVTVRADRPEDTPWQRRDLGLVDRAEDV